MSNVTIIFKNGKELQFKCTKFTVRKGGITDQLVELEWEHANIDIMYIDFADIMCIYADNNDDTEESGEIQ